MNWGGEGEESNNNTTNFAEKFHKDFKEDFMKNIAEFFTIKIQSGVDMNKYKGKMKSYIEEIYGNTDFSDLMTSVDKKHYVKLGVEHSERALDRYLRKQEKLAHIPAISHTKRKFAKRSFLRNEILGKTKRKHRNNGTRRNNANKNMSAKELTVSLRKEGFNLSDLQKALNAINSE